MRSAMLLTVFALPLLFLIRGGPHITATSNPHGDGRGASCEKGNAKFCPDNDNGVPISPHTESVPGPLALGGVWVAYQTSRRLRTRIKTFTKSYHE